MCHVVLLGLHLPILSFNDALRPVMGWLALVMLRLIVSIKTVRVLPLHSARCALCLRWLLKPQNALFAALTALLQAYALLALNGSSLSLLEWVSFEGEAQHIVVYHSNRCFTAGGVIVAALCWSFYALAHGHNTLLFNSLRVRLSLPLSLCLFVLQV